MPMELLDIQPRELKFIFELKKQSSCRVQLVNNSDQYVAFKVKTTYPKRYCVRPNTGILLPKSTCDFTVIMQAQRVPLADMQCKDKFLIQSTVVPSGTTAEDITGSLFTKENGRYIEENKLKVVLVSPPQSPVLLPTNGSLKQEPAIDLFNLKDQLSNGVENLPPSHVSVPKELESAKELEVAKEIEELKVKMNTKDVEELKVKMNTKEVEELNLKMNPKEDEELNFKISTKEAEELRFKMNGKEADELKLKMNAREVEELKLKINDMESKLNEAEKTLMWLSEERSSVIQEKEVLKRELALLRKKSNVTKVQVGFPLLFVCFIALVGLTLGYMLRA